MRFVKMFAAGVFAILSLVLTINLLTEISCFLGSPYALGQLAGSGFAIALGIALSVALFKSARQNRR